MKKILILMVFNYLRLLVIYLIGYLLRYRVESYGIMCLGNLCLLRSIKDKGYGIKCLFYSYFMIIFDILLFVGIDLFFVL